MPDSTRNREDIPAWLARTRAKGSDKGIQYELAIEDFAVHYSDSPNGYICAWIPLV